MRTLKLSALFFLLISVFLMSGCNEGMKDLRIQNDRQSKELDRLRAEIKTYELKMEQLQRQLTAAQEKGGVEVDSLQQQIAALEEDIAKKKDLIASMQQKLLMAGGALPAELSTMIEDFAKAHPEMVSFDANRGIIKFKSDLLFEKGSDTVAPDAIETVKALCSILNSEEGKKFDIVIAGHTDDIPISKPDTRAKHATNWHLSAHRAISVLNTMANSTVEVKRLSVRGFGEYRPVEDNLPGKKGNPQNRRVEIYIVPQGA